MKDLVDESRVRSNRNGKCKYALLDHCDPVNLNWSAIIKKTRFNLK
jgi:hypothetical protein